MTGASDLTATLRPRPAQRLGHHTSREVMSRLLGLGHETLLLQGALIEQFSAGVELFVEEDAHFLLHYYSYVERLLAEGEMYEFDCVLGDGLLAFTTVSDRTTVNIEFRYSPGLDVANLVTHYVSVTEDEYVWWWRSIASGLLDLAGLAVSD